MYLQNKRKLIIYRHLKFCSNVWTVIYLIITSKHSTKIEIKRVMFLENEKYWNENLSGKNIKYDVAFHLAILLSMGVLNVNKIYFKWYALCHIFCNTYVYYHSCMHTYYTYTIISGHDYNEKPLSNTCNNLIVPMNWRLLTTSTKIWMIPKTLILSRWWSSIQTRAALP